MSDNEFDKLFQDRLFDYEVEPTDAVWSGISEQISSKKAKRGFPYLLVAAASLAAFISFGIWLAANKEPMKLTGTAQESEEIFNVKKVTKESASGTESSVKTFKHEDINAASDLPKTNTRQTTKNAISMLADQPIESPVESVVKTSKRAEPKVAVVSDAPQVIEIKGLEEQDAPVMAMASDQQIEPSENELSKPSKHRQIKSVGSLVNFVVSKVDRRKEKIIQFQDGDEGTMVSSMNLGLLKFKAKD